MSVANRGLPEHENRMSFHDEKSLALQFPPLLRQNTLSQFRLSTL
jgi:hypothetical protein